MSPFEFFTTFLDVLEGYGVVGINLVDATELGAGKKEGATSGLCLVPLDFCPFADLDGHTYL